MSSAETIETQVPRRPGRERASFVLTDVWRVQRFDVDER